MKKTRDRVTIDIGGLRERILRQAQEPNQSLSSIIRMLLIKGLDVLEAQQLTQPITVAQLVQQNIDVLRKEIPQRAEALARGDCPTDIDLVRLAYILDVDEEYLHRLRGNKTNDRGNHEQNSPVS